MEFWDVVKAAGIPALLLGVIITSWVQIVSIKRGVQALLRDRLLQGYKFYRQQGWADEDDRSNMENIYLQYHRLGANGVMDNLHDRFLQLPADPPPTVQQTQQAQAVPANVQAPGMNTINGGIHE